MQYSHLLKALCIGAVGGLVSGAFGIGGGVILVPLFIFVLGYSVQAASGTSLVALLLPVGALGVIEYFRAGKISADNIRVGLLVGMGLFIGTYFGAKFAVLLPAAILQRAFAVFLVLVAAKLWFSVSA